MTEPLEGLSQSLGLLGRLDEAARDELGVELAIIGREGLAAQRAATPKDTGELAGDLSIRLLIERLKIRIGLLAGGRDASRFNGRAVKARAGGPFYGRIVYFGRKAQTVLVTRRIKQRRLSGNNKNGMRRSTVLAGKAYTMKVRVRAGVPFIDAPGAGFAANAEGQIAEYWARTFARAGGPA
ncbi:hypothetical protein GGQ80_000793 [Sphingomonas jinjuensis]|uniref:Uncharacterized protein n=1 Tax=Sphingomonas jinjuensis TaxID=535907 RepID=A0A840FHS3_9SPHN|nr:hypothetical protein [Sphingomonas jinjuensis]MBB4152905.1 hypothetical protein [Sphingomonas jinjuensis]